MVCSLRSSNRLLPLLFSFSATCTSSPLLSFTCFHSPSRSSAVPLKSSSSSAPSRTVGEKGVEEDAQEEVDYDALYESKSSTLRPKSVKEILAEKEAKRLALLEKLSDTKQRLRSVSGTPGPPSTLAPASTESSLPGTPATNQISKAVGKLKVEGTASPALNPPAVLEEPSKQLNAEDDSDEDEEGAINESDFIDLRQSERVVHEPVKHLAPEDGQSRLSSNGHPGKDSGAGPRTTDLDAMEVSAADYNPDEDRMLDDRRERERFRLNDSKTSIEPPQQHPERPVEKVVHVTDKRSSFADSRIQEGEEEDDDDDDDMFVVKKKKPRLEDNNVTSQEMQEAAKMAFVPVSGDAESDVTVCFAYTAADLNDQQCRPPSRPGHRPQRHYGRDRSSGIHSDRRQLRRPRGLLPRHSW